MAATKVHAEPTKTFFIHTITKDISLEDCILDLIDNSLDGARRTLKNPEPHLDDKIDLSQFQIDISFDEKYFSIKDNCGGISLTDAVEYAFTFGRRDDDAPEQFSIGLYGIGLKRAVFKMGELVDVDSTYAGDVANDAASFRVHIDVEDWRSRKQWDFDLEDHPRLAAPGVHIHIRNLHKSAADEFTNPSFANRLRHIIARDYSQFLSKGMVVRVNGRRIKPFEFTFLATNGFKPFREQFKLMNVGIEIVAGLTSKPSSSLDPDEDGGNEDRSGWYVICNGRIVLAADKSELSGWGFEGKNRWHPQYRGFLGLILFSAASASDLPLTTTKRSIDRDKVVYRLALARMMDITKEFIEYTNRRKLAIPEAQEIEKATKSIPLSEIPRNRDFTFPSFKTAKPRPRDITIQYPKPPEEVRRLAAALGDPSLSAREVGLRSFDFAYEQYVGDE